jgi:hypothetical protein
MAVPFWRCGCLLPLCRSRPRAGAPTDLSTYCLRALTCCLHRPGYSVIEQIELTPAARKDRSAQRQDIYLLELRNLLLYPGAERIAFITDVRVRVELVIAMTHVFCLGKCDLCNGS